MSDTQWLSHDAAAVHLGVSGRTLDRYRAAGDAPPSVRFGRTRRYRRADLDAWANQHADPQPANSTPGPEAA